MSIRANALWAMSAGLWLTITAVASADTPSLDAFKDGAGDAADALQHLVDQSEGLIELPPGTYKISRTVTVDLTRLGYRGLRGAGGTTSIVMTGPGPAFRFSGDHQGTAAPTSFKDHTWQKERFPLISELEIVGAHPEADGIALYRTMQSTIQNVAIRNCRLGVHLVERNRNFLLANSHIYDGGDSGLFFDHCDMHQANIIGNHISYNKRAGIRQYNGHLHNIQITGNDIEYNSGSTETSGEIVLEGPESVFSEWVIAGNTIQARPENSGANIYISGANQEGVLGSRIIAISGNIIGSREKNIYLENTIKTTITGNTIYGGRSLSVHVKASRDILLGENNIGTRPSLHDQADTYVDGVVFEDCTNSAISANIMNTLRAGTAELGGAVLLRGCQLVRVSQCQILNPPFRAIHVVDGEACVLSGNVIASSGDNAMLEAIAVTGKGAHHVVRDNTIWSIAEKPIRLEAESTLTEGNTIQPVRLSPSIDGSPQ